MPKPQDIFQLAQQEAVRVTASPQAWRSFLYTAAHNYHTTYLNQLLIHAQRPDAAACASMEYWNTKANRLVMRGSRSITVLQRRQGVAVTKPVFAIGDTTLLSQTRTGGPWEVTDTTRPLLLQDKSDDWLAALAQELLDRRAASATLLLYIASLPTLLFAQFVYNINLMILLGAGAMLCFARYARTGRVGFGLAYAALAGLATVAKPNAEIVLLALLICALLHGWANRDVKIVLFAALSFAIGKGAFAAVAAWYGKQGGVDFRVNVSMLARLAMGMQESPIAAGWYNKYTEQFFAAEVTAQQEKAQALAAIGARLGWMRKNPAAALAFYREKLLTQWLDPAYDSLWMGELSEKVGRYNGLIGSIYRRKDGLRTLMDGYMDAMQTAVYALSAVGGARLMKKKDGMAALALPVTILGGALYHLIFEAKAQYAYPYMVYMLPLAAAGLCTLAEKLKKISG